MSEITTFEQSRILLVKEEIIHDYQRNSQTKKIVPFETVSQESPDFITIYTRPLFDRIWFSDSGYYPNYGSLGGTVARGEVNHIISRLKETVETGIVPETEFTLQWLESVISLLRPEPNTISLIGSVENIYQKIVLNREWKATYDDVLGGFKVNVAGLSIPLHSVIKQIIGNDIIILNKSCCRATYRLFHDQDLDMTSTLFMQIKPYEENPGKMDVLLYSKMRFEVINRRLLTVFKFEPLIGEPLIV